MVVIRLTRRGNKHRPYYVIVVIASHARRDGRFIEEIGFYNPIAATNVESIRCDKERLNYWIAKGAQVSLTVKRIVKKCNASA